MSEDIESSSCKNVYMIILSLNACVSPVFTAPAGFLISMYKYVLLLYYVRSLLPPLTLSILDRPSFVSFSTSLDPLSLGLDD